MQLRVAGVLPVFMEKEGFLCLTIFSSRTRLYPDLGECYVRRPPSASRRLLLAYDSADLPLLVDVVIISKIRAGACMYPNRRTRGSFSQVRPSVFSLVRAMLYVL